MFNIGLIKMLWDLDAVLDQAVYQLCLPVKI
jgi:hypothetical protein